MSGLAGCITLDGAPLDPRVVQRMATATPYLGPDGADQWCAGPVGFVRFKHTTTPQAAGERQPIHDGRTGLTLCFDGRLDNRDDLLRDLRDHGIDAAASDATILLALFARDGDECVRRLVGDYAFAIWQPRTRRLFCGRSPLGWRPFFWCRTNARLGFATEA